MWLSRNLCRFHRSKRDSKLSNRNIIAIFPCICWWERAFSRVGALFFLYIKQSIQKKDRQFQIDAIFEDDPNISPRRMFHAARFSRKVFFLVFLFYLIEAAVDLLERVESLLHYTRKRVVIVMKKSILIFLKYQNWVFTYFCSDI